MGLFSKTGVQKKIGLVFDIGSSSIGGSLFRIEDSKVPRIIFSTREPIVLLEEMNIDQFFSLTLKTLHTVADKIAKSGLGAPDKIFCVLSSPWYATQSRIIKMEKNVPFIFNTKLADTLIQKEISQFKEEHKMLELDNEDKLMPIELKNMKIILNGYVTPEPLNQKTKDLEMLIFIAMSSGQFLEEVEEIIKSHFHRDQVKFSSFLMASFTVARDLFSTLDDFLLVDVGGEMTAISMTKKDALRESASFPLGKNFIIRGVAKWLGCTLDEAKSLVSLHKDEHGLDPRLEEALSKVKLEWLKKFQESLATLSPDISIPSDIFLTADQDFTNFFSEIIKGENLNQYTLTDSKFKINSLGLEALHGAATLESGATRDPYLIIDSIYINRYLC